IPMSMSAPLAGRAIRPVPLSCLVLAAENVRKTAPHPSDDAGLKASIANHGLLENLVVRTVDAETPDRYAVIAGGRRLAALQSLRDDGEIPADHPVPCLVADSADNPGELSLVENTIRIPMHPVDQVTAFTGLAGEGFTVAAIAARFGVSERIVEQRIRLGNVAPEILEAYRADETDLEVLKAFAVTTDRERQMAAWRQVSSQGYRPTAWQVKRLLTEERVPAASATARFVGIESYEAAGGKVLRDLFARDDESGVWFEDPALLERLAIAKLTVAADELVTRWKWAEAQLDTDWNTTAQYVRVHADPSEPTAEEKARLDRLNTRELELSEIYNTDDGSWTAEHEEEFAAIEAETQEIEDAVADRSVYSPEAMAIAGCIVTIGHGGELQVIEGLVRPEDQPDAPASDDSSGAGNGTVQTTEPRYTPPQGRQPDPAAKARKDVGIGVGLSDDMTAIRTSLVKAHLSNDFGAAFDLALYQMALSVFGSFEYRAKALSITTSETAQRPTMRNNDEDFAAWSPGEAMLEDRSSLSLDWMTIEDTADSFAALRALPQPEKQALFAAAVARTLDGQLSFQHRALPQFEATVARLDIDFASHVRPTAGMFWSRINKSRILDIARATLGIEWATAHSRFKKDALAKAMEAAFAAGP
ncbi:MAG: ParB/RepB/Spo0J family partition protein, partial [Rhodospirillales bacterium]|nr:ParB/RepB/Spo0J family partition protein [Rhodospirillales bacterium]